MLFSGSMLLPELVIDTSRDPLRPYVSLVRPRIANDSLQFSCSFHCVRIKAVAPLQEWILRSIEPFLERFDIANRTKDIKNNFFVFTWLNIRGKNVFLC